MPEEEPHPVVTLKLNDRIREAECSLCRDPIVLEGDFDYPGDQMAKLNAAFARHVALKHRGEDIPGSSIP